MAKLRKHHRRHNGFTLPLLPIAGFIPTVIGAVASVRNNWPGGLGEYLTRAFTGYSPYNIDGQRWHFDAILHTWGPIVIGILGHKIIGGKLGVNRVLANAGIPFIRL